MSDHNLSDLDIGLQPIADQFLLLCNAKLSPSKIKITITYRSADDQNAAHQACLSNAAAGYSPHNCCDAEGNPAAKAFDVAIFNPNGSYVTDGTDPRYAQAGEICKSLGLEWGGDWTLEKDNCHPDYDHFQLANWQEVEGNKAGAILPSINFTPLSHS